MHVTIDVVRIKFLGPFYFSGTRPEDYTVQSSLPLSDTLFAAVCQAWHVLGLTEPLKQLAENPTVPYLWLTDLYPFVDATAGIDYYFPRLWSKLKPPFDENPGSRKIVKSVQFLTRNNFESQLAGTLSHQDLLNQEIDHKDKKLVFFREEESSRVQVTADEGKDNEPYWVSKLRTEPGVGFWMAYQTMDASWKEWFLVAMSFLQTEGLGTDRTFGYGHFELAIDELQITVPAANGNTYVNLGLYIPSNPEELQPTLEQQNTKWQIIKRGGWITTEGLQTYRKRNVYAFKSGSIFCFQTTQPESLLKRGVRVDLRPLGTPKPVSHPIWRSGQTLFLPITLENDGNSN